jgi:hypothetical protein
VRSAQVAPWSKTGGLGDVCGSLPPALAARGHRVMVVSPRYANYDVVPDSKVSILDIFPTFEYTDLDDGSNCVELF